MNFFVQSATASSTSDLILFSVSSRRKALNVAIPCCLCVTLIILIILILMPSDTQTTCMDWRSVDPLFQRAPGTPLIRVGLRSDVGLAQNVPQHAQQHIYSVYRQKVIQYMLRDYSVRPPCEVWSLTALCSQAHRSPPVARTSGDAKTPAPASQSNTSAMDAGIVRMAVTRAPDASSEVAMPTTAAVTTTALTPLQVRWPPRGLEWLRFAIQTAEAPLLTLGREKQRKRHQVCCVVWCHWSPGLSSPIPLLLHLNIMCWEIRGQGLIL